jgi:hypothetical protein
MLDTIFAMQKELRTKIGDGVDILEGPEEEKGLKIFHLIQALRQELSETQDELYWKWWCEEYKNGQQYQIRDKEKIKVEMIDCFCFLLDMLTAVGVDSPDKILEIYKSKWSLSMKRQEERYKQNKEK